MRIVLQRCRRAAVVVGGETVGQIGHGLLILLGIHQTDTAAEACKLADKVAGLRIFEDAAGKMNRSVQDVAGSILLVSQFTLYGDCSKGRRPSFMEAARPELAEPLYEQFAMSLRALGIPVATGRFGADMQVELVNDGPVTLVIDAVRNCA